MKKHLLFIFLLLFTFSGTIPASAAPAIHIDTVPVHSDVSPYIREGRTMVPIRFVSEEMGADVEWIGEEQRVSITLPTYDLHVDMVVGVWEIFLNGLSVPYDEPICEITDDRVFVPLRFVADAFGCHTLWIDGYIEITTPVSVPMDFEVYESVRSFLGQSEQALKEAGLLTPMPDKPHTYLMGGYDFKAFFSDEGICHAMNIPVSMLVPEAPTAAILTDEMVDAICGMDMPPFSQIASGSFLTYRAEESAWEVAIESKSPIQTVDNSYYHYFFLTTT